MQKTNKNKKLYFWPVMAIYFLVIGSAFLLFSSKASVQKLRQPKQIANHNIVILLNNDQLLGNYLVDKSGLTLYTFKNDNLNESKCLGDCIKNWPPLLNEPDMSLGLGLTGILGAIERPDGQIQITYNGKPLYRYIKDKNVGEAFGQGMNKLWYIAKP